MPNRLRFFSGEATTQGMPDRLALPQRSRLLVHTEPRPVRKRGVVIQGSSTDRKLYLVAAGSLEVEVTQVDGISDDIAGEDWCRQHTRRTILFLRSAALRQCLGSSRRHAAVVAFRCVRAFR